MNAIEKRALELLCGEIDLDPEDYDEGERIDAGEALRAIIAALTPPEGYVLVPVDLLRMVIGCAYPVSTDINQRGYAWSEAYLDQMLPFVKAALAAARPEVP